MPISWVNSRGVFKPMLLQASVPRPYSGGGRNSPAETARRFPKPGSQRLNWVRRLLKLPEGLCATFISSHLRNATRNDTFVFNHARVAKSADAKDLKSFSP